MASSRRIKIDLSRYHECCNPAFYPIYFNTSRFVPMVGGAGSGKSVFASQKVVNRVVSEQGHRFLIVRKIARTLRASVFQLVLDWISHNRWTECFHVNKSDMVITFLPTLNQILFTGMDDQEKIKSIAGITGIWVEEATELSEEDLDQLDLRLRGNTRHYKQILLTFNPISANHWLKRRFFDIAPTDRVTTLRTTYLDNQFLDPEYKTVLEDLRHRNPSWWKIYGEGEWGVFEGLVYTNVTIGGEWPSSFDEEIYGLDFGFNNPTALVRAGLRDTVPYLRECIYQSGLTNSALIALMREEIPDPSRPIYADAAEPGRIAEIRAAGFNCIPADKSLGSLKTGISYCQGLDIHVSADSPNLIAEFGSYVWGKDKNGVTLEEPVKFKDHGMDAARYALYTHHGRRAGRIEEGAFSGIGAF